MARLNLRLGVHCTDAQAFRRHLEWMASEYGAVRVEDIEDVAPHKRAAFEHELKSAHAAFSACFEVIDG